MGTAIEGFRAPHPQFSVVIPVYNRPDELRELLQSLCNQHLQDFEVIVVDDGSQDRSDKVVEEFRNHFSILYFFKSNSGPGPSRNYGFHLVSGDYFVIFDSDCIVPPHYFSAVAEALQTHRWDAWGGPDKGHPSFTPLQRAMAYTMSSIFTTGGIRGGKKRMGWFQPRSFNMGISREVFMRTGGFRFSRYAEDIELSIRMKEAGFKIGLIPEAFVFHKRRSTLLQFFKQVFGFGKGRVLVGTVHPGEVKVTHWLPTFFLIALLLWLCTVFIYPALFVLGLACFILYFMLLAIDAYRQEKSWVVAILSIPAAFVQLTGYGLGFLLENLKNLRN